MKICSKGKDSRRKSAGFTLVEVMFAALILVVLALGSAAILQQSGTTVAVQKNKRVAVEAASRQFEGLRSAASLATGTFDSTVLINGQTRKITTIVDDIGNSTRPLKRVTVRVEYRPGGNEVVLETYMDK